jgi:predicted dinucleotide-binding enzyme
MNVGIVGSGDVGLALANGFIKHGFSVMMGTNNSAKREGLKKLTGGKASVGKFEDAAKFGELIVLAVKGTAAEASIKLCGPANFKGKTVIDAVNPISEVPPVNGVLTFFTTFQESLMERLQKLVPDANFVKAFNSVGNSVMVNPDFKGQVPTMFICGNNSNSKKQVAFILEKFGWEAEDMGTAHAARAIEPLCILWCIPGFVRNDWVHALKLLKK